MFEMHRAEHNSTNSFNETRQIINEINVYQFSFQISSVVWHEKSDY